MNTFAETARRTPKTGVGSADAGRPGRHRFCVAPMMARTDRHFRYLLRLLSRRAMLYTEMLTTGALLRGDTERYAAFHEDERPLGIQLGGSNPAELAACAKLAERYGYDEVNLNLGCPSARVKNGRFGACLMRAPDLVAECIAAMTAATRLPITVKTRTGVDAQDGYDPLARFVDRLAGAGCQTFIIHARKALLHGLSPKQNRSVPPLQYDRVYRLKQDFPGLEIIINGGIGDLAQARRLLRRVDGVMLGRAIVDNPYLLAGVDQGLFGDERAAVSREQALREYGRYMQAQPANGIELAAMARRLSGLFHGQPGARAFRRYLSEPTLNQRTGADVLRAALGFTRASCQPARAA